MALNLQGGPTYIENFVDSPIIVNSSAGEFYKQPMFYALGHFSKFVQRGSIRLGSSTFCDNVMVVAFQRPDNATAVVILNRYVCGGKDWYYNSVISEQTKWYR